MQPKVRVRRQRPAMAPDRTLAKHNAVVDSYFSSGDAVAAVRLAAGREQLLSRVGFAKDSHRHSPVSTNPSHLSGSEVTGLLPAEWEGGNRNTSSSSMALSFYKCAVCHADVFLRLQETQVVV